MGGLLAGVKRCSHYFDKSRHVTKLHIIITAHSHSVLYTKLHRLGLYLMNVQHIVTNCVRHDTTQLNNILY